MVWSQYVITILFYNNAYHLFIVSFIRLLVF